jgi:PPE-repeat protein
MPGGAELLMSTRLVTLLVAVVMLITATGAALAEGGSGGGGSSGSGSGGGGSSSGSGGSGSSGGGGSGDSGSGSGNSGSGNSGSGNSGSSNSGSGNSGSGSSGSSNSGSGSGKGRDGKFSTSEVVRRVRNEVRGEVIAVRSSGGVYSVKVIDQRGRIVRVRLDASSGRIIGIEGR